MVRRVSKIISSMLIFGFSISLLMGQNLVPNSSFELYRNRPLYLGGIRPMENWFSPTRGTPDIYKPKPSSVFYTINNRFGSQIPQDGNAYMNIIFECSTGYEYLSVKLTMSLKPDSLYCISFEKSLMDKSKFLMSGLGVDLSVNKPNVVKSNYVMDCLNEGRRPFRYEYYKGENVVRSDEICNDKENWTPSSFIYKAKGGEQYLTIGIFFEFEEADFYNVRNKKKSNSPIFGNFGLYIDNVSMLPISDSSECSCYKLKTAKDADSTRVNRFDTLNPGSPVVLNDVLFEIGSSVLLPQSFPSLNEVAEFMKSNIGVKVEIRGHTDNQGDSAMNMQLSRARAEAVVNYLVGKDIDPLRLTAVGFGDTQPVTDNKNEEGRMKNRRVEFIIVE